MTTAQGTTVDIEALRALVGEHRKILEALESKLAANTTSVEQKKHTAAAPPSPRDARVARSEVRRAARRASGPADGDVWVAMPAGTERSRYARFGDAPQISDARRQSWRRSSDALTALQRGDARGAWEALREIYETEKSIQLSVDDIQLPAVWRGVADEVSRASDMVIDAAWEALTVLRANPSHTARCIPLMTRIMTGGSNWSRSWRTFVQVIPARAA